MNGPLQGQFADTLLSLEKLFYVKLMVWGAMSVLLGTSALAALRATGRQSPLIRYFAILTAIAGVAVVIGAASLRGRAGIPDYDAAVSLDRALWALAGCAAGLALSGAVLMAVGWRDARSRALAGAGAGVIVQATALAVLALQLASAVVR